MAKIRISVDITFIILLLYCLLAGEGVLFCSYLCALLLHEIAHFVVFSIKGYRLDKISFTIAGVQMLLDSSIKTHDESAVALAGPMCNLLVAISCMAMWWWLPVTYYYTDIFFSCNITLCAFNLLPVTPLDGSKIWGSVIDRLPRKRAIIVRRLISLSFFAIFAGLFIWSLFAVVNVFFVIVAIFFLLNFFKEDKLSFQSLSQHQPKHPKRPTVMKVIYLPHNTDISKIYFTYDAKCMFLYRQRLYTYDQLIDII